jgi:DNA-binding PadR family transcriptional regulator
MPRSGRGAGRGRRGHRGHRRGVGRGDVRIAVLALLAEEPMHGYQIMTELTERSGGIWRPSPGSIYPLLQQLADEGLVTGDHEGDRKVFRLTPAGQAAAAEQASTMPIWERVAGEGRRVDLRDSVEALRAAAREVSLRGTDEQATQADEILTDARKRLYQLLAQ